MPVYNLISDGNLTVFWVAAVDVEVLMCIAWLHIRICLYMMFFEVDPSIQEDCLLSIPGGCKLNGVVASIETHQELLQGWRTRREQN